MRAIALLLCQVVAVVDPHLDTDVSLGGGRLGETVIHLGAKGPEGNRPQHATFAAGHFRPAQTPRQLDANATRTTTHGGFHGPLQGAAEALPLLELIGDILGHQLGIDLGIGHFDRFDINQAVGEILKLNASIAVVFLDVPTDLLVFDQQIGIFPLGGAPVALPVELDAILKGHPGPETVRIDLLTHQTTPPTRTPLRRPRLVTF